jgi:hypothetical protein
MIYIEVEEDQQNLIKEIPPVEQGIIVVAEK